MSAAGLQLAECFAGGYQGGPVLVVLVFSLIFSR